MNEKARQVAKIYGLDPREVAEIHISAGLVKYRLVNSEEWRLYDEGI